MPLEIIHKLSEEEGHLFSNKKTNKLTVERVTSFKWMPLSQQVFLKLLTVIPRVGPVAI